MSTPENPESGQLTRRQMREIRTTASTPVVGADTAVATEEPPAPPQPKSKPKAPLPRPARPVAVAPAPVSDASVDLGVSPLTRRQARQQERIRTASVPVITPEVVAALGGPAFAPPAIVADPVPAPRTAEAAPEDDATRTAPEADAPVTAEVVIEDERDAETDAGDDRPHDETPDAVVEEAPRVDPRLGEKLLGENPIVKDEPIAAVPASFDDLLSRESGSVGAPHALILNHVPEASPLSAITSTGEVIVTGIYNLPDGLGSQGHAHGAADGKDIDAALIDGELPAHSSPTPIAASAAISTVRGTGEIIRPPAPEKSSRWVMGLMITAGALALALVGLLVYVVATGVFN